MPRSPAFARAVRNWLALSLQSPLSPESPMSVVTYTGLEPIAKEIDASAPEIAYVVLQRPDGRHRNPEIARIDLDADSLSAFVPTFGKAVLTLPPDSPFRKYLHGPLASALVAWLRAEMERYMPGESEVKFKVNLWGPKGSRLHRAFRVRAVRVSSLTNAVHARYGDPSSANDTSADRWVAEQLGYLVVALSTHGMAMFHANVARLRGEHDLAEKALRAADEAMRLALALGGFPDVALDRLHRGGLVLPFRSGGGTDSTPLPSQAS